jgi:hypothetical protein
MGDKGGRSEEKEGFFGNKYTQHYDTDGSKAGTSEGQEGFWGNKYTQHYDTDGSKAGTSEGQEDFWGNKYTQHYKDGNFSSGFGLFGKKDDLSYGNGSGSNSGDGDSLISGAGGGFIGVVALAIILLLGVSWAFNRDNNNPKSPNASVPIQNNTRNGGSGDNNIMPSSAADSISKNENVNTVSVIPHTTDQVESNPNEGLETNRSSIDMDRQDEDERLNAEYRDRVERLRAEQQRMQQEREMRADWEREARQRMAQESQWRAQRARMYQQRIEQEHQWRGAREGREQQRMEWMDRTMRTRSESGWNEVLFT